MQEAAEELGLTVEAIRKRVQRGSILVEELRDRVRSLEGMLGKEREACPEG